MARGFGDAVDGGGGDARCWDEEGYRKSILREREIASRTVFRTTFAPSQSPDPETLVVASSDGSIASYTIAACIDAATQHTHISKTSYGQSIIEPLLVQPNRLLQGHKGPAYDLKFYSHGEDHLLLSCGDDGCIRGWSWKEAANLANDLTLQGHVSHPLLEIVNPQHEGPWGARSPIPENNAIAVNEMDGSIFSAAGDSCAYSWDVETGKQKVTFKGHSDYLQCISARKSSNQIITGSEDGTARIWDCRSGICTKTIHPEKNHRLESSWVSSVAIDESESWLACGTGSGLSVWSLLSSECIFSVDSHAPLQDLCFDGHQILAVGSEPLLTRFSINGVVLSQIRCAPSSAFSVSRHASGVVAVGGYGGLVDIISQFGSHLCTFCCQNLGRA